MIALIVAAEVAFWVFLGAGLAARYLLQRPRLSRTLLLCVPAVDLVLVVAVVADTARGAEPDSGHWLAAVYLGVTVAFGHSLIRWADVRFRHRFAGGPAPAKPAKGSPEAVRALWTEWFRAVAAAAVAAVVLVVLMAIAAWRADGPVPFGESPLRGNLVTLAVVVGIWFLAGPAFARTREPARH